MATQADEAGPNKERLYGEYLGHERWRSSLHRRACHKALDIPTDEDVNINNSRTGIGLKEILAIGMLGTGGIGLMQLPAILTALSGADPPPIVEGVDTSVKLGLGKLSDYLDLPSP